MSPELAVLLAAPAADSITQFIDAYHLWSVVILLCAMGFFHLIGLVVHWGFRLCGDAHEEYCHFKARCEENRRRYARVAGS